MVVTCMQREAHGMKAWAPRSIWFLSCTDGLVFLTGPMKEKNILRYPPFKTLLVSPIHFSDISDSYETLETALGSSLTL